MSASRAWAYQEAVYDRLVVLLAGQAPDGGDVPVYDHARPDPPRLFVRIDGFDALQDQASKNCDHTRQAFFVHVFDRPTSGATAGRGQQTVKQLGSTIVAGLRDWRPLTGSGLVVFDEFSVEPDEDGLTQHWLGRFHANIGEA